MHTIVYDPFSIVVVPFPFTDSINTKKRPALVISSKIYQKQNQMITLLMVTTAHHNAWLGDHLIQDLDITGLPLESIVRQKIFSIDKQLVMKKIGDLSKKDQQAVLTKLQEHLAIK